MAKNTDTDQVLDVMDFELFHNVSVRVFKYQDRIVIHYCKGNHTEGQSPWANISKIKTFKLGESAIYESLYTGYHLSGTIMSFAEGSVGISQRGSNSLKRVKYVDFCYRNRKDDEEIQHDNYAAMMNT